MQSHIRILSDRYEVGFLTIGAARRLSMTCTGAQANSLQNMKVTQGQD
jgi:hypothetical protein